MDAAEKVSTPSGQGSPDSKASGGGQKSMLELLMVTDAAVKALNKSMRSQSSTSSHGSKKADQADPLAQSLHSDRSVKSVESGRSVTSAHSVKSGLSQHSGQSVKSARSGLSARSQQSAQSRDDNAEEPVSQRNTSHDSGVVSKTQTTSVERSKPREIIDARDGSLHETNSDVSTTASDILIRSTHERSERSLTGHPANGNSSTSSKCSKASFGLENFNSTGPQKVKISKKRLKEIKSPFDDVSPTDSVSSDEKVPSSLLGRKSKSSISSVGSQHSDSNSKSSDRKPPSVDRMEKSNTTAGPVHAIKQGKQTSNLDKFEVEKVRKSAEKAYEDVNLASSKHKTNSVGTASTSSRQSKADIAERQDGKNRLTNGQVEDTDRPYRSTPKYFVERHTPQKPAHKVSDKGGLPERKNLLQDLEDSVEIITAHAQDSSTRSSQPDIVTVPERIVTISSKASLSPASSLGEGHGVKVAPPLVSYHGADYKLRDDNGGLEDKLKNLDDSSSIPPALTRQHLDSDREKPLPTKSQWFSRQVHGHGLQQGAPVNGLDAPDKKDDVDIEVSDFKLNAKQRLARESFAKRQGGPVRRVVQPRLVGHDSKASSTSSTGELKPQHGLGQANDQVLTAAAAASAAVAATQPFLKVQYEMEAKMSEVLTKIQELQSGKTQTTMTEGGENERVKQLEQQLSDMTEKRIDYMEKLQEQQMAMQAKLLSLTREASSRPVYKTRTRSPGSNHNAVSLSAPNPNKAFSKTIMSDSHYKGDNSNITRHSIEADEFTSPLDTPAPRARAPKPTTYDTSGIEFRSRARSPKTRSPKGKSPKSRSPKARSKSPIKDRKDIGILHQILASTEVPQRDIGLQRAISPVLQTRNYDRCESPNVKKAKVLEADLSDIKEQVKGLVAKENLKNSLIDSSLQAPEKPTELSTLSQPGPSPLDSYLKLPERTEASPYKKVPDVSFSQFNAPVLPGFKDAWSILQEVQKSRGILETNMEAVMQARQSAEVYTMLEALYNESSNPEGAKIQKLVDKHIKKLRREVEREVTDDLVLREIGKVKATGVPGAVKVPAPAPAKPTGRYGTRSRLHEPKEEPKKPAPTRKPAPVLSRPAPKRTKSLFEDESKLTQVYGKAAYQKGRTTVKDPYLHYQNTAKHKAPRPAGVIDIQGKERMSSKTQTTDGGVRQFYFNPNTGTYIPIASAGSAATPVPGQLVPMAVPLGGPRMDPGMSLTSGPAGPVTFGQPPPPQVTAAGNVAMVTVGGEDKPKPVHELGKQVLPAVDIDTDVSEMSEVMEEAPQVVRVRSPEVKPKKHVQIISPRATPNKAPGKKSPVKAHYEMVYHGDPDEVATPEEREESSVTPSTPSLTLAEPNPDPNHTSDDTLVEDDVETAPGLEFPGYQPVESPDVPYNGPVFPPQLPPADRQFSSDLIAADIKHSDLLQNKATEWMEQELMARIISEVYPLQDDDRPTDLSHVVSEGSEDSMAEEREKSMFVMDSIGHRGLQLFVDMGKPVDSSLVNNLIQEVLTEKIRTMLGERHDQQDQPPADFADPTEPKWEEPIEEVLEEPPVRSTVVSTPEPTPKASPTSSPHRPGSPAYTPIPSPPLEKQQREEPEEVATPRVYEAPPPVAMPPPQPIPEPESEPESSASYDIKEELRRLADQLRPGQDVGASIQSHHGVATPPASPKPEPPPPQEHMYRPLTPPQLSPRAVQEPSIVDMRSLQAGKGRSPDRTPLVSKSDSPKSPKSQPIDEEEVAEQLEDQPAPVMFTVAETQTDVVERPRSRTSTPTKDKSRTPSESSYTESSSVSESFNECVSEGQWLVNKSDGEVADFPIDDVAVRERMLRMAHKRVDVSSASTWKDIDDMDEMEDLAKSEGEFVYKAEFPPEKDPVLDLLARLQTAGPQYGLYNMNQRQVTDVLNSTGKSEGEVIRVAARAEPVQQWEEPLVRQAKPARRSHSPNQRSHSPLQQRGPSPSRRSPSPQNKSPSPRRSKSPQFSQSPHKRAPSPLYRTQSPTRVSFEDEQLDVQRSVSPTRGILKQPRQYAESQGRLRREEEYDLPVRDTGRGQAGRLGAGGRQPQVRGMIGAGGRTSPGKPSMRRPPQVIKSSTMPEASSSGPRLVKVRSSSEDFRDSNDPNEGYYGSLRGTRSMTPDQMNTDALIQSGYLSQSFSQSETNGRHTAPSAHSSLKSSGDLGLSRTSASGRSLGYSYGTESSLTESELRRLATGGTGKLQMSLTIPGTDIDGSDLSEIDITDGGNTK